ncbi:hypothetical protein [Companilactobacillus sp.]|jgi:hypothetical protein|uniref:hypothetical protein n=1 Tax=Companilactobacillus sp. TaxID=2767905 RepID=UPI0025C0EE70|nr:hypothetical protein [Companilactobacillus sp.]MCH4009927.1 hypothetical protein [Companilactobacillus sp.]MCH4052397.1 hypothetical protein [Companilactobacillus sp.]MCH4077869.1 hypothetical protein [Companilactobacillus sp.]MCH4126445.1 hypothetical protein [Companilactobacillus sp.]MCH4132031.1 hypothetical protein [Companilactobacillus sp.]
MKNNIKYAGIAAAALLTVAPIATPVVNSATNTQVAQAATTTPTGEASKPQKDVLADYFNTLTGKTVNTAADFNFFDDITNSNYGINQVTGKENDIDFKTFSNLYGVKATNTTLKDLSEIDGSNGTEAPIQYNVTVLDGSSTLRTAADVKTKVNDIKQNGGSLTLAISAKDATGQLQAKQLTFTNSNKVTEGVKALNVQFTSPLKVDLNSSVVPVKYTTSVDATVEDQNGNDIKTTNPVASQNIYTNAQDALNMGTKNKFTNSTFDQKGSYYQAVEVTLDDSSVNADQIFKDMQSGKDGLVTFNGQQAIQKNVSGNTLRFVREIQVGDPTPDKGEWEETASAGKVTVGNSIAHLYNDDNDLTSRSVAGNTDWATDKYRTNTKTGQIQYHVSTHEWVNATDVTFTGNGNNGGNTNNGEGLTNVTDLQGTHVVNLAGPEGFVYTLFTLNGGQGNRGLAGLTSWATDKTAQDANGNTYYRVSTDEWVRAGEGVTFN